jgi:hypothetical protein
MGGVSVRATGLSWHRGRSGDRRERGQQATQMFFYSSSPPVVPECSELKLVAKKLAQHLYNVQAHEHRSHGKTFSPIHP